MKKSKQKWVQRRKTILLLTACSLFLATATTAVVLAVKVSDRNEQISNLNSKLTIYVRDLGDTNSNQALSDTDTMYRIQELNKDVETARADYNELAIKYRVEHPNEEIYILGTGPRWDCLASQRSPYQDQDKCPDSNE